MKPVPNVAMIGGDRIGWALDVELALTRKALTFARPASLLRCEVIHTPHWPILLALPGRLLRGRRVIAHMAHAPEVAAADPQFSVAAGIVTLWVVRSRQAKEYFDRLGLRNVLIPYIVDDRTFHPLANDDSSVGAVLSRWRIPRDAYLIGSFQRDTEGNDLRMPKLVKGPDIFAEIVGSLHAKRPDIHVVLAGPRRHWMRERLRELKVPFTFVGTPAEGEDIPLNVLDLPTMNVLYNLVDLYVVSSRKEGGPMAVPEAARARCKIISTDVGHAADLLHRQCIYTQPGEAASIIAGDMDDNRLQPTVEYNFESAGRCLTENVQPLWKNAYGLASAIAPVSRDAVRGLPSMAQVIGRRLWWRFGPRGGNLGAA